MKTKNTRKGFTIVELVIVIAVIAILATVLVPTFGDVVENANKSSALQEARNDFTSYMIDNAQNGNANLVIQGGDYYFVVVNNELQQTSYATEDEAKAQLTQPDGAEWTLVSETYGIYAWVKPGDNTTPEQGDNTDDNTTPPQAEALFADVKTNYSTLTGLSRGSGNMPYVYASETDQQMLAEKKITKIGIPVHSGTGSDGAKTLTVYVIDCDALTKIKSEWTDDEYTAYTVTIPEEELEGLNSDGMWIYVDVSDLGIEVHEGQTLGFGNTAGTDTLYFCFKNHGTNGVAAHPMIIFTDSAIQTKNTLDLVFDIWAEDIQ